MQGHVKERKWNKDWSKHTPAAELRQMVEGLSPEEALKVLRPHVRKSPQELPPTGKHLRFRAYNSWGTWGPVNFHRDNWKKKPAKGLQLNHVVANTLSHMEAEEKYQAEGNPNKTKQDTPHYGTLDELREVRKEGQRIAKIIAPALIRDYGQDMAEDEKKLAEQALETAVEIMHTEGQLANRLSAARLVLDFTKSKPVSKQEVAVSTAEDFLAGVLAAEERETEDIEPNDTGTDRGS